MAPDTIAQMTRAEFKQMLESVVEEKLLELFGDPDAGRQIRKAVRERLLRQREMVASGESGRPFEDVVQELGLE